MTKKLSSYQKLKAKNAKMSREIFQLIQVPDGEEAQGIRMRYSMQYDLMDAVWMGEIGQGDRPQGIFALINKEEKK